MSDDAWDWSHNGVGGAPAWNWEGAPQGVAPLRLPKSPLPERRALAEKVEADARKRQFLAAHGWTAHSDPETGYEFWQHAKSGATQWEPPDVREVVEQARRERSGEAVRLPSDLPCLWLSLVPLFSEFSMDVSNSADASVLSARI